MEDKNIEYPTDPEVKKKIRYEKWCPYCKENTLRPPLDVPVTKARPITPESAKSTMEEYVCRKCGRRYHIPKQG